MPIRTALVACAIAFATLATVTAVFAGDTYGGFGPSDATETQEIGSNPDNGAAPPDSDQTLPWLQQQGQHQQDTYGSEGTQQGSADQGYDTDDEGGH